MRKPVRRDVSGGECRRDETTPKREFFFYYYYYYFVRRLNEGDGIDRGGGRQECPWRKQDAVFRNLVVPGQLKKKKKETFLFFDLQLRFYSPDRDTANSLITYN